MIPDEFAMSQANLDLLATIANADQARSAVQLLLVLMLEEGRDRVLLVDEGTQTGARLIQQGVPVPWTTLHFDFGRVSCRLAHMSGPPHPWWHSVPGWYGLSFHITERIDHWFWKPRMPRCGKIELMDRYGKSAWLAVEMIDDRSVEIRVLSRSDGAFKYS